MNKEKEIKFKKINIFNMKKEEIEKAYFEAQKDLLELNLKSKKENISGFSYKKKQLKKNIARCMMYFESV